MSDFTDGPAGLRRHITRKRDFGELDRVVATRMLAALDGGADPDYMALLTAAQHVPLPDVVFHTARPSEHDSIAAKGLLPHDPGQGVWGVNAVGQVPGVYVGAALDVRGVWADGRQWHVWAVRTAGLTFLPDSINRDCWFTPEPVPVAALSFTGTFGEPDDVSRLSGSSDSRETSEVSR